MLTQSFLLKFGGGDWTIFRRDDINAQRFLHQSINCGFSLTIRLGSSHPRSLGNLDDLIIKVLFN